MNHLPSGSAGFKTTTRRILGLLLAVGAGLTSVCAAEDPVGAVAFPSQACGYPSRDADLDALPGFLDPPPGYGQVPFWWWTGDPLDVDRLTWQLEQLHEKGISGVQVNYAHEDSPGWPTYAAEPPIFSDAWWRVWGRIADECRRRGMGIGLSTYTLDWTRCDSIRRRAGDCRAVGPLISRRRRMRSPWGRTVWRGTDFSRTAWT